MWTTPGVPNAWGVSVEVPKVNGLLSGTLLVHENQRLSFREGSLRDAWARTYPMIFDEKDLKIARNQPN